MAFSQEEIDIARAASDMADRVLPSLIAEMEELRQRIEWHQENRTRYRAMTSSSQEVAASVAVKSVSAVLDVATPRQRRAKRGEAQDRVWEILSEMPNASAEEIRKAVLERYGTLYGSSTIYRAIDAYRQKKGVQEPTSELKTVAP